MSLGAILAMKRLGLWVSSMGAKKAIGLFSVLYPLSLWLVFLSPSFAASCLLLMAFGLSLAVLDVATNVEATAVERASGHKFMSKLHGMFSLGGIGGSLAGLLSHRLTFSALYYLSVVLIAAGRFSGDTLRRAVREKTLLSLMATLGFIGMSIVLLSSSPGNALVGFLLLGLGISTLVPLMFIIAASQGEGDASKEIALVTRMAYTGMLLGPVIIGALSGWLGLQLALWLVAILLAGIALTAKARRLSVPPAANGS